MLTGTQPGGWFCEFGILMPCSRFAMKESSELRMKIEKRCWIFVDYS